MTSPSDNPPSELDVVHDEEGHRYLLQTDGEEVGRIDYRASGQTLDMHHTEIISSARGRGLGAVLVRGALEDARERDRSVVPSCWYVREFIEANDEFQSLVAAG